MTIRIRETLFIIIIFYFNSSETLPLMCISLNEVFFKACQIENPSKKETDRFHQSKRNFLRKNIFNQSHEPFSRKFMHRKITRIECVLLEGVFTPQTSPLSLNRFIVESSFYYTQMFLNECMILWKI